MEVGPVAPIQAAGSAPGTSWRARSASSSTAARPRWRSVGVAVSRFPATAAWRSSPTRPRRVRSPVSGARIGAPSESVRWIPMAWAISVRKGDGACSASAVAVSRRRRVARERAMMSMRRSSARTWARAAAMAPLPSLAASGPLAPAGRRSVTASTRRPVRVRESRRRRSGQRSRSSPVTTTSSHSWPAQRAGVMTATPSGRRPRGATESEGRTSASSSARKLDASWPGWRSAQTSARLNSVVTTSRSCSAASDSNERTELLEDRRATDRQASALPDAAQAAHRRASTSRGASSGVPCRRVRRASMIRAAVRSWLAWTPRDSPSRDRAKAAA